MGQTSITGRVKRIDGAHVAPLLQIQMSVPHPHSPPPPPPHTASHLRTKKQQNGGLEVWRGLRRISGASFDYEKCETLGLRSMRSGNLITFGATAARAECRGGQIAGSARGGRESLSARVWLSHLLFFVWKTAHLGRNKHILREAAAPLIWPQGPIKVTERQPHTARLTLASPSLRRRVTHRRKRDAHEHRENIVLSQKTPINRDGGLFLSHSRIISKHLNCPRSYSSWCRHRLIPNNHSYFFLS